jgi:hypothetical protein
MSEEIYIQMPVPAFKTQESICTRVSCGACTRQDCKDYGPQIAIVGSVFLAALIGIIIFLVHTN